MRKQKYHIYLDEGEYRQVIESVINLRNHLIEQGKYTDLADEVLDKLLNARIKKMKIKYV
ncbi:hypothetical protein P7D98_06760 [Enterococcus avium]|uniref:hypothetical protein n=1 Tax=Enterococcus avium TaxID=33945 RepID=UPI00288E02FE|nr:hypothetical protein [Enterococcus avium]MDT2465359.1 hypothetical protein [Enterococcus avium]MDT2504786.1 hypothetical protein [Enterococcus avium]